MEFTPRTCDSCNQIFRTFGNLTALLAEEGYRHHDRQSLINSALQGCLLCEIIWNTIEIYWDEDEGQILTFKAEFEHQNDEQGENDVDSHPFRLAANGVRINLFLKSDDDLDRLTAISLLPISPAGNLLAHIGPPHPCF